MNSVLTERQTEQWLANSRASVAADGAVNVCAHAANSDRWAEAGQLARDLGLNIRHNVTNTGNYAGVHRYVVYVPGTDYGIRSIGCVGYWATPHSKWWLPSIGGEAACIGAMITWLRKVATLPQLPA